MSHPVEVHLYEPYLCLAASICSLISNAGAKSVIERTATGNVVTLRTLLVLNNIIVEVDCLHVDSCF